MAEALLRLGGDIDDVRAHDVVEILQALRVLAAIRGAANG
jgi:hypothetical protein